MLILSLILSAIAVATAEEPCPEAKPVENFNITAFTQGKWYEIARFPNLYEERADCVSFHFIMEDDLYKFQITDIIDHSIKYVEGYMDSAPNASNTGLLSFYLSKNKEGLSFLSHIVATDYDNYQISYECMYDEISKKRSEFAWIGSRTKVLSDVAKAAVDDYLKNNNVINTKKLIYNHFTEDSCSIKK